MTENEDDDIMDEEFCSEKSHLFDFRTPNFWSFLNGIVVGIGFGALLI